MSPDPKPRCRREFVVDVPVRQYFHFLAPKLVVIYCRVHLLTCLAFAEEMQDGADVIPCRNTFRCGRDYGDMKFTITLIISVSSGIATAQELAPRHEIGLTLGGLFGSQHSGGLTRLGVGSGLALQANYGYRLAGNETAPLYGEVHFLANPLRQVNSTDQTLTQDAATIFLTPGLRVKFFPNRGLARYLAVRGG